MSILTYVKQDREHVLFSNTHMILNQNWPNQTLPSHFINEEVELIISDIREMK